MVCVSTGFGYIVVSRTNVEAILTDATLVLVGCALAFVGPMVVGLVLAFRTRDPDGRPRASDQEDEASSVWIRDERK